MKNSFLIKLFVGFVKLTGVIPALLFFKPRVIRVSKKSKPAYPSIIVSNHKSLLDFVLYLLIFPFRTIRFLMAEVLYNKSKLFAWFLNSIGGVRVDRDDKNFGFISESIEILDKGGILGIFPEGRLPIKGKPFPFTASTAFIATHATAPIIPVYTDGNYGFSKRAGVVIGEAFYLTDYIKEGLSEDEQLKHLTQVLEEKVYALKENLTKEK